MWVGTDRDGLYLLDAMGKQLRHYTFPNTIEALCFDSHHRLWIGSYLDGCGYLDGGSYHPVNLGQGVSVFDIKCDAKGNVWLATLGNGLVMIRPDGTLRHYTMAKGADNNFKVIPFKSIVAVQAKLKSTLLSGYIEFETANSPLSVGSDKAERNSENSVILSGTDERYAQAKEALQYIFDHICK